MSKENGPMGSSSACCPSKKLPSRDEVEEIKESLALQNNLREVKHKIIVLSGKGGVGKSTVAANIAAALSLKGKKVGLVDVDIHGPSIPKIMGLESSRPATSLDGLEPVQYSPNLAVMSVGFLLRERDDAIIWRAPLKHGLIKQFLAEVNWGKLDYLVVDCPPGTGDEPLSVIQLLEGAEGAVVVTTPQDVSLADVRKSINFCRATNLPVLGVVENMSGFVCPHCANTVDIFKSGGGEKMASEMGVPFLGRIPIDPKMVESGDSGKPFVETFTESETSKAFSLIIEPLLALSCKE
ncbi:MAG: Mrp/NBP35 family ATP-binding protein [Nitrospirae bacterium]|nr:Mrp/NBP35 family ATP-binding protein [Nitrospirota bacterium]